MRTPDPFDPAGHRRWQPRGPDDVVGAGLEPDLGPARDDDPDSLRDDDPDHDGDTAVPGGPQIATVQRGHGGTGPFRPPVVGGLSVGASAPGATRVRAPSPRPVEAPSTVVRVGAPGRHASRVPRARLPDRVRERAAASVPDTFRGRVRLASPQVAVLSALAALGLVGTVWFASRGAETTTPVASETTAGASLAVPAGAAPSAAASPGATAVEQAPVAPSATATGAASSGAAVSGDLVVDVAGKVRRPGIVELPPGSRLVDALAAAGGALAGVDLSGLNQARPLVDGEQVLVGRPAPSGVAASAAPAASPTTALVNINSADASGLDTLPGVGPVTAQKILDWRAENGAFSDVDELLEIDGIGEATLADLAPYVTL